MGSSFCRRSRTESSPAAFAGHRGSSLNCWQSDRQNARVVGVQRGDFDLIRERRDILVMSSNCLWALRNIACNSMESSVLSWSNSWCARKYGVGDEYS